MLRLMYNAHTVPDSSAECNATNETNDTTQNDRQAQQLQHAHVVVMQLTY